MRARSSLSGFRSGRRKNVSPPLRFQFVSALQGRSRHGNPYDSNMRVAPRGNGGDRCRVPFADLEIDVAHGRIERAWRGIRDSRVGRDTSCGGNGTRADARPASAGRGPVNITITDMPF